MANINWATLGATIPAKFQDSTDQYDMNPEMFSKGMDELGSVFDRWTREHAIDGMTKAGKQKRLQKLKEKLASLEQELVSAKMSDTGYQADQAYALAANTDPVVLGARAAEAVANYTPSEDMKMVGYTPAYSGPTRNYVPKM